ncbi:MAG TPA: hypothetical protein P5137_15605 [Candidatus Brocadiia bacterium]|nr:hypothetical protein [Candidatus Brocadiia bacterium]
MVFVLAVSAVAGTTNWYYSGTDYRYDPASGIAQQYIDGHWVTDSTPDDNPAKLAYLASQAPCAQAFWPIISNYNASVGATNGNTIYITSAGQTCAFNAATNNPSTPSYNVSETPKWDFDFWVGAAYESTDFTIDADGARDKSDVSTVSLGVDARKGRFLMYNNFRYQRAAGRGDFENMDRTTLGVTLMPGYAVLLQEEAGVRVETFALLGLDHVDCDYEGSDWRFTPGVGVTAARMTPIGLFKAGYTFNHSRSLNGDDQVTGCSRINLHGVAANYAFLISKNLIGSVGGDYVYACQVPSAIANEFATARVGLTAFRMGAWTIGGAYHYRFLGGSANGFDVRVTYSW